MSWLNSLKSVASPQNLSRYNRLGARFGVPLGDPLLWRPSRRTVAGAAAVGACVSFWVPIAQIPLALILSGWLRWNLPAAALGTFVNTPLTYAPVYWLAAQIGQALWSSLGLIEAIALGSALLGPAVGTAVYLAVFYAWGALPQRWREAHPRAPIPELPAHQGAAQASDRAPVQAPAQGPEPASLP